MRFPISKTIVDKDTGAVIVGALGTVRLAGTVTAATIYSSSSGGSAISGSQVTADSRGEIEFWVDSSNYVSNQLFDVYVTATNYNPFTIDNLYGVQNVFDDFITKGPYVDVRAFGAVGDGVTDNAIALQNAINYANTNNLTLYLPAGVYLCSAKLTIVRPSNDTKGFGMYGDGRGRSIIKYTGAASIGVLLDLDGTTNGYTLNNHLRCFKLDLTDAPSGTVGLQINAGVWRSRFENLYIMRDVPGGGRTGKGIYMGSATGGDVGCFDNKFSGLYVNNFSKNLHFQGTDLSGNTITNCPVDHSYIANGDYNLYAEFFNGLSANNTQYENAVIAGAHFVGGETYVHMGGTIESPVSGAVGISMDANTKSVIAFADFYNNDGGHFVHNGKVGHFWKSTNSGIVIPSGGELRIDRDASYKGKVRFFRNGVTDVYMNVANAGTDEIAITKADGTEVFGFDLSNKRFEVNLGSILIPNATTSPGIYSYHGTPEGVITANPGSICLDSTGGAGTSLYVKESGSGNTGWVAK